ncbi:hypothetical protein NMY22_g10506 [Coprinellus aureogranulatus]|nr:hypothetical protein NMY22_g10506 [Coprinellus aureogranulatus]
MLSRAPSLTICRQCRFGGGMLSFPLPPSNITIFLGCSVPCLAFILVSAYAFVCSYHKNLTELRLEMHRTNTLKMLLEKEVTVKSKDVQVASLSSEKERLVRENRDLRQEILDIARMKTQLEHQMMDMEADVMKKRVKLEVEWPGEYCGGVQRNDFQLIDLRVQIREMDIRIQTLQKMNEDLEEINDTFEKKIYELTDKLGEYHRRLVAGGASQSTAPFPFAIAQLSSAQLPYQATTRKARRSETRIYTGSETCSEPAWR